MHRVRPILLVLVVAAIIILTIALSHGIRVRLTWGASGFVAGFVCGVLLTMELHHRRRLFAASGVRPPRWRRRDPLGPPS